MNMTSHRKQAEEVKLSRPGTSGNTPIAGSGWKLDWSVIEMPNRVSTEDLGAWSMHNRMYICNVCFSIDLRTKQLSQSFSLKPARA